MCLGSARGRRRSRRRPTARTVFTTWRLSGPDPSPARRQAGHDDRFPLRSQTALNIIAAGRSTSPDVRCLVDRAPGPLRATTRVAQPDQGCSTRDDGSTSSGARTRPEAHPRAPASRAAAVPRGSWTPDPRPQASSSPTADTEHRVRRSSARTTPRICTRKGRRVARPSITWRTRHNLQVSGCTIVQSSATRPPEPSPVGRLSGRATRQSHAGGLGARRNRPPYKDCPGTSSPMARHGYESSA